MKITTSAVLCFLCLFGFISCKKNGQIDPKAGNPPYDGQTAIATLAQDLQLPWGMVYLPNGDLLFTERKGKINLLKKEDGSRATIMTRQVNTSSEGGLLSITIDPSFDVNHYVYIYETIGTTSNRVVRLLMNNNQLSDDQVIVDQIPYGANHDGGALKFGPDGFLYIGTGDAQQSSLAQDKNSLAGKILRVDRNGNPAPGNPFNNKVWTYGHRNVQGFTWMPGGQMLATEHGPSGENGWCCHDEINLIRSGNNYGWPLAYGGSESGALAPALVNSGDETWAPSGCTWTGPNSVWPNCLVVASLKGERLLRFYLDAAGTTLTLRSDTLQGKYNRIRNIVEAPDGALIFCTSNVNSIPSPAPDDDKIYRLHKK